LPRSVTKKLRESEAVFVGEVVAISIDAQKRTMAIKFRVERHWKGVTSPDMIVITSVPGPGSCGLSVEVGSKFLIYASRSKQLETSLCSSRRIEAASDEMKKLGKGKTLKI
jgi:2-phosphoglycerate kinase